MSCTVPVEQRKTMGKEWCHVTFVKFGNIRFVFDFWTANKFLIHFCATDVNEKSFFCLLRSASSSICGDVILLGGLTCLGVKTDELMSVVKFLLNS